MSAPPSTSRVAAFSLVLLALLGTGCEDFKAQLPALPPDGAGTAYEDSSGRVKGTGWRYYYYPDGKSIRAKDAYVDSEAVYSAWLKPDGSLVADQRWVKGTGMQYYLWDDGSVKSKIPMVEGVANGTATYYRPDGSIEKRVQFKNGKPFNE